MAIDTSAIDTSSETFRKILIPMIRRTLPSLIASDLVGVQPMTGPSGMIFGMKAKYGAGVKALDSNTFDDWLKGNGKTDNKASVDRYIEELENAD